MSIWESSQDPGAQPANLPDFDKHLPDNRPADGTAAAATNKTDQQNTKPFLTYKDAKLWSFNGERNMIFIGVDDDGKSVARILKPEAPEQYDVFNAPDEWLLLNSEQNIFKVAKVLDGKVTLSFGARGAAGADGTFSELSTNSLILPHNLGYVPVVSPHYYDPVSGLFTPVASGALLGGPSWTSPVNATFQVSTLGSMAISSLLINVDATNVYIQGLRYGWSRAGVTVAPFLTPEMTFKIYCQQETASIS